MARNRNAGWAPWAKQTESVVASEARREEWLVQDSWNTTYGTDLEGFRISTRLTSGTKVESR